MSGFDDLFKQEKDIPITQGNPPFNGGMEAAKRTKAT